MEDHLQPITLGTATNHYADYPVALSLDARLRHLFILGQTGTGKTSLMQHLAISDMRAGNGFAFFDPHGQAVRELLDYVPANRTRDVVYVRPSDRERSFGFNVLQNVPEEEKDLVTQEIVGTFRYLWADSWGARMHNIFKHTVRALLDAPVRHGSTLLAIPLMLTHADFRRWILKHVRNPAVRQFWEHEFETWNSRQRAEFTQPILNKTGQFLLSDALRNVIGQAKSTIDLRYMMDNRKILLVDLDKGQLGADDANILGSLLVTGIQLAAMRRSKQPEHSRIPFYCYLDEFHSFTTQSFASILAESRKYKLGLILAAQYLDQIQPEIRSAVFGNCGNLVSFRISGADAPEMGSAIDYPAEALEDLAVGKSAIRYLNDGHPSSVLAATPQPDPAHRRGKADRVIAYSNDRYTTPTPTIDKRLARWLRTYG